MSSYECSYKESPTCQLSDYRPMELVSGTMMINWSWKIIFHVCAIRQNISKCLSKSREKLVYMYIYIYIYNYRDVIMGGIASQFTSLTIVYSTVYSDVDQRKHQSPASLAYVRGIQRGPVNSSYKWPVTQEMLPFDDVIMLTKHLKHRDGRNGYW